MPGKAVRASTPAAILASLALAACTTVPARDAPPGSTGARAGPLVPPVTSRPVFGSGVAPAPTGVAALPGWREEDHAAALAAFQAGCGVARDLAMRGVCARAQGLGRVDDGAARVFFEANFRPQPLGEAGVMTAYFAPEYPARAGPDAEFSAPVLGRPADLFLADLGAFDSGLAGRRVSARLTAGVLDPYPDRTAIEAAATTTGPALAWMRAEDLFFLQIQGSGVLAFPDGERLKAVYAGDNGQPFVAIARPMVQQGMLAPDRASGDAIRRWLSDHRGAEAEAVMRLDPRYVFFALAPADGREPPGAAGIPLSPGRSIAVDPFRHAYGELYWIDASAPVLSGATRTYRRLALALDTGAAIRGEVRADLYIGSGAAAGEEAGRVRHTLRMVRLVPLDQPAFGSSPAETSASSR